MLFNFKISGSKEGGWYLECELNKPPFIEQLLPNLEKQKIKRPLYELGTNVITTVSFLNNSEADINRNDEKLKEALKAIQHLSGKEYNIRSIQYSMNYEEILKMFLVQSWREYKYGIIYVKLYNVKLIFNNLIKRPQNDEVRKQLLDMIYDIYKKIVKIQMELQNESRGRTEQQPATQQKEIKMFTQNELIDVLSTDSNSQQLGNTPNNQLNETISPSFHPGSSSIKQTVHANQLPNIQHENITHRPHSIPLHNPNTNLQHSRQIMQQNLAIGLTSNHPRPNVPTITGSDYMQLRNLNRNFRPSSSQINQNPVQYQFLSQRFPSPGLGKSGMISFNQIPANRTQSENRPISLPQPLQKPIQHHGQTIQQQSTQQHPLPNIGSSNANIFKPHALPNSPLFQQLPKRTSTSYFNAAGGVGQLHNIRGSSSSTPNQHQMFPPGFEQTIARKNEIFNKNSNVYSGQTLHEIQQLRQQQSKQFGIQHSILIPGQFQHSGQGTLQQQTLNSEQYLQQFNRQLQKDVQNPFQQQPPSQQNTGTSSQKNYSDLLAKQNSGAENPNTSTQQMADNLNKEDNQQDKIRVDLTFETEEGDNQNKEKSKKDNEKQQDLVNIEQNKQIIENINNQLKNNEDINKIENSNKQKEIVSNERVPNSENFVGDIPSSNKQKQPLEGTSGTFVNDELDDEEMDALQNLLALSSSHPSENIHSDGSTTQNKEEELRKIKGKSKLIEENEQTPKEIDEMEKMGNYLLEPTNFSGQTEILEKLDQMKILKLNENSKDGESSKKSPNNLETDKNNDKEPIEDNSLSSSFNRDFNKLINLDNQRNNETQQNFNKLPSFRDWQIPDPSIVDVGHSSTEFEIPRGNDIQPGKSITIILKIKINIL
uniref:Uncharacterized protein n=1 Tax=Meloidogyne enterolobii TaxID=390850 RepID=A0A6V7WWC2_MELEN|nr:unnamed protein product [Meloidogyne enterolobii]